MKIKNMVVTVLKKMIEMIVAVFIILFDKVCLQIVSSSKCVHKACNSAASVSVLTVPEVVCFLICALQRVVLQQTAMLQLVTWVWKTKVQPPAILVNQTLPH